MIVKCIGGSLDGQDYKIAGHPHSFKHHVPQTVDEKIRSLAGLKCETYETYETYEVHEVLDLSVPGWTGYIAVIEGMAFTPDLIRRAYG